MLWDGAAAVNAHNLPARVAGNIIIWGLLAIGGFYLLVFKDYSMGFELAILSLGKSAERRVRALANSLQPLLWDNSVPKLLPFNGSSHLSSWACC